MSPEHTSHCGIKTGRGLGFLGFFFFFSPGQYPQVTVEQKMKKCGNSVLPENPAGGGGGGGWKKGG